MRLIDADALIEYIRNRKFSGEARWGDFEDVVDDFPTAYDVEAKVAELENASYQTDSTFDEYGYCNDDSEDVVELQKAISIVRGKE